MPTDLDVNRHYAALLGWTPQDVGAAAFNDALVPAVRALQGELGVTVDGRFGPNSFRALVKRLAETASAQLTQFSQVGQTGDRLAQAGRVTVLEAKQRWLDLIVDPPDETQSPLYDQSRKQINAFINSKAGLGWSWEQYVKDNDYQWCGAFAANAWRAGGVKLDLRRDFYSSCHRLDAYARYRHWNDGHALDRPADHPRLYKQLDAASAPRDAFFSDSEPPRAGDILLIGDKNHPQGTHICLVEAYDILTGTFTTLEGNAVGAAPNGRTIEGVIRAQRHVGARPNESRHARRLIRPSIHDLD